MEDARVSGAAPPGSGWTIDPAGLGELIGALGRRGFDVLGPVVRDGAIVQGHVRGLADLPEGWHDEQAPGYYRLHHGGDGDHELFGWAVGPSSPKSQFFPPEQLEWRAHVEGSRLVIDGENLEGGAGTTADAGGPTHRPVALFGVRPCEVAAVSVLDRVLGDAGPALPDPAFTARRSGTFVAVVECATPSGTCFCDSMGTGPSAGGRFDLAIVELHGLRPQRFLVQVGSKTGGEVLADIGAAPATDDDWAERDRLLAAARGAMGRTLPTTGLRDLLAAEIDHPRWDEVAERCLSCGNCTLVCPTCFCSDVDDVTDLSGTIERRRRWASCFDLEHSHLTGGAVRQSVRSRYRQWLTHKLSTWWDQFDTSGCVGCGRCITWCPVGIDLTEEVAAIAGDPHAAGTPVTLRAGGNARAGAVGTGTRSP